MLGEFAKNQGKNYLSMLQRTQIIQPGFEGLDARQGSV
jgi:hypothetical protein